MLPLPPNWPKRIPGLPLLFVFVGAPLCFEHASFQQEAGFSNHVILPDARMVTRYDWPTAGLMVIVILFCRYDQAIEEQLVATLLVDQPVDVTVRIWPTTHVIRYTP